MPLTVLAASPATPPLLLDRLFEHALTTRTAADTAHHGGNTDLRVALAVNPAVPLERVRDLARGIRLNEGRERIIAQALTRPGLTAQQALELLAEESTGAALTLALRTVDDPAGILPVHAMATCAGAGIWDAIVTHPATPAQVRWDAAEAMAAAKTALRGNRGAHVTRAVRDRMAWATTPTLAADAIAWRDRMVATAGGNKFLRHLTDAWAATRPARRVSVGNPAWVSNPATPTADVIAWAGADLARWHTAVRTRRDPDHAIARAAAGAYVAAPEDGRLARALLKSHWVPDAVKQDVARAAATAGHLGAWGIPYKLSARGDDPDRALAMTLASPQPTASELMGLMSRHDLRAEHLDQMLPAMLWRTRGCPTVGLVMTCIWLATYPTATPAHRATARHLLANASPQDLQREHDPNTRALAEVVLHTGDLDPADPDSVLRLAARVPLSAAGKLIGTYPGLAWLAAAALTAHSGALTKDAVDLVPALVDGVDSLPGLLTAAAVITA